MLTFPVFMFTFSQLDLVDKSSVHQNIKTTSEEGRSEHFPPLTTNAIYH